MAKELSAKEKRALEEWDKLIRDILNEIDVEDLTYAEIQKKKKELEANPEEWIYYMFKNEAKYKFARFQVKAIMRIIKNADWYEVLSWARELAKSSTVCYVILYLVLTGTLSWHRPHRIVPNGCFVHTGHTSKPIRASNNFTENKRAACGL